MHVRGSENKYWAKITEDIFYLILKYVSWLAKTQKPIQMFQLGVGHSQMHPPLFYIPASVLGFVYSQETGRDFTNARRYNFLAYFFSWLESPSM